MRAVAVRVLAGLFALTWWVLPGFGLIDLSVSWDPAWPVVLEASWGVSMTVLVGGSFLALAVRPAAGAPAQVVLLTTVVTWVVAAAAGLEWQLLGYVGVLVLEAGVLLALLPARERLRPAAWSRSPALLVLAALGAVPWLLHADDVLRANRRGAGEMIGELTMGVDHHAVQGALALALVALAAVAGCWPRGRRFLGVSAGLCAGYVGLVSSAFPNAWAGFSPTWSLLCLAWGAALVVVAGAPGGWRQGRLRLEVAGQASAGSR